MSSSSSPVSSRLHPFPSILRTGALVLILGMTSVFATAIAVYPNSPIIYYVGIAAAVVSFAFFRKRNLFGRPTTLQSSAIYVALVLGILLLIGLFVFIPGYGTRNFLLLTLLIIDIVFIPLSLASGPQMLLLAGLCIAIALLGLWLQHLSYSIFGIADGVVKIIFGLLMLRAKPGIPAPVIPADASVS